MRTVTIIAATALALTSTVALAREGEQSFQHDGATYVYTTKQVGKRQVIDGQRLPAGSKFHLVVADGRVSGLSGGVPVQFRVAQAAGAVEVAAR